MDLRQVFDLLMELGFGFFLVLGVYTLVTYLDTLAWTQNFKPRQADRFNVLQLWRIRQIGEAYNVITPLGTMGGEPVKAQLLKDHHGLTFKQGLASLVTARTTFLTALILFFVPGIVLIFQSDVLAPEFKSVSLTGMIVFSSLIFLFFLFQITGIMSHLTAWCSRFTVRPTVQKFLSELEALDELTMTYYRKHPQRALKSISLALAGWVVGLGETYLILRFIGYQPSFAELWIIEALSQLVRMGTFFIPLSIGAQEVGLVMIFTALGLPGNLGLAVSFARRAKELTWVGLGLVLGWALAFKPVQVQPDTSEG